MQEKKRLFESADVSQVAKEGKDSENASHVEQSAVFCVSGEERDKEGEAPLRGGNSSSVVEQKPVRKMSRKIKVKKRRKKPSVSPALVKRFF